MPIYTFVHEQPDPDCPDPVELLLSIGEEPPGCPHCGAALRRVPSSFSVGSNVLSSSNIKDKGFQRWTRRDKGVYEKD